MYLYFQIIFPNGEVLAGQAGSNTIKAPTEEWLIDWIVNRGVGKESCLSSVGLNSWRILDLEGNFLGMLHIGKTRFG